MIPGTMALVRPGALLLLLTTISASHLRAQTGWWPIQTPSRGNGVHVYDPQRGRTVFFNGSVTYEYDGNTSNSWTAVSPLSPRMSSAFSGAGYDHNRRRVVYYDRLDSWEWDGSTWVLAGPRPPIWSFMGFISHIGRGTVIAFGGPSEMTSNDLYEWNGTGWSLLPTTGRPPRPWISQYVAPIYLTVAYDARRDKVVVFGSAEADWFNGGYSNYQPDLWEWDATNGWVQRVVQQGSIGRFAQLFFDSHRGVMTLVWGDPTQIRVAEWDGGPSWQPITPANPLPATYTGLYQSGSYDDVRGQFYVGLFGSAPSNAFAYGTVSPARFEIRGLGCLGSLGEPKLRLTHNWTRAWLGRSLSVDLTNLPMSSGIVALGWSDQQHGSTPLPLDLTPFGMPGCSARVAPDSVYFVAGSNQTATLSLPVPANPALLGGVFFQQGYAFDPAANPLGLATSGSVRLTIGSL